MKTVIMISLLRMNSGINRGTETLDTLDMDNASDSESSEELVNPDDTDASSSTSKCEM